MEAASHTPKRRSSSWYLVLAGFIAGSFAGAAFGTFFALSIEAQNILNLPASGLKPQSVAAGEDAEVISAVKKVSPSVVSINVLKAVSADDQVDPFWPFAGVFGMPVPQAAPAPKSNAPPQEQKVGGGTGFIISSDGLVMTNRHVVLDAQAHYQVVTSDGKTYDAKVLARDQLLDLAILKIEATGLPVVDLGDSDALQAGETVVAIGNALEYSNSVTKGVISGKNRHVIAGNDAGSSEVIDEAIQTDAAINPGNSGGPLIDIQGKVIGVNTAVNQGAQSIGFAIPINDAKTVIASVKATGKIVRSWLGVRYVMITPDVAAADKLTVQQGALVIRGSQSGQVAVTPGSPADKAGIAEHDIILKVDGLVVDQDHPLAGVISRKNAGDTVKITLLRAGKQQVLPVTLGTLPDSAM